MSRKFIPALGTLSILVASVAVAGDEFAVTKSTIDGGGGTSTGGDFTLTGTIGQYDAAEGLAGGDYTFTGGFWGGGGGAPPCPGDTTGDGLVDVADLLAVLAEWGPCSPSCSADTDGDGIVDVGDLLTILAGWGVCP